MRPDRGIKFPYKIYKNFPSPIITLEICGPKGWFDLEAYVDSGAFYSIFCTDDAEMLGLDYKKGKLAHIVVGDGNYIPVYFHNLPLKIGSVRFDAVIGFSSKLGVGFNLLGRRSIFERCVVIFDDAKRQITFIPKKLSRWLGLDLWDDEFDA